MKRRTFLIGSLATIGGLALGYRAYSSSFDAKAAELVAGKGEALLAGWVKIAEDDTITVYSPHVEMGQGIHTGLAMMLAEELDADWSKMKVEPAPAEKAFANRFMAEGWIVRGAEIPSFLDGTVDTVFAEAARFANLQQTGGSTGIRTTGQYGMRIVGAAAREMLLETAAERWGVSVSSLTSSDSVITHKASGKTARYGELVLDAAGKSVSATPRLKKPEEYKIVGKPTKRMDIPQKVNGTFEYGMDLKLPGMKYLSMKSAPVHGGKLLSIDDSKARKMKGVEHVIKVDNAYAVLSDSFWTATKGVEAVEAKFSDGGNGNVSSASIREQHIKALKEGEREVKSEAGDVSTIDQLGKSDQDPKKVLSAQYHVPYLHHAATEPLNVTAQWKDGKLTVWSGSQNPLNIRAIIADLAGLSFEDVHVNALPLGGAFGRRGPRMGVDIYLKPLIAAAKKASPAPVKLIWTREEDFAQGCYRPQLSTNIEAAIGKDGKPVAWHQTFIMGFNVPTVFYEIPYNIPNKKMESIESPAHVRTGAWRSVNHSQHGFWNESIIDELAHMAGQDPYEYRMSLLNKNQREYKVLKVAAEKSGWGKPLPEGRGRGIAVLEGYGSVVAHVFEISMNSETGAPIVHKVVSAVDCGRVVNPIAAKQQIEGGILMGISSAIWEEITIENGKTVQENFPDYQMMNMENTPPEIDIHFVESDAHIGGLGEPGLPPVASALANAVFNLTGKRIRSLPLINSLKT